MRKVHKAELKPGMVLGKTLVSSDSNTLILERGAVLDGKKIEYLKRFDLRSIYVLGQIDLTEEEISNIDNNINKLVDQAEKEAKEKGEFFDRISFLKTVLEAQKIDVKGLNFSEAEVFNNDAYIKGLVFQNQFKVDLEGITQPFNKRHERLFQKVKSIFEAARSGTGISLLELDSPLKNALEDIKKNDNVMARLYHMETKDGYTFDHSMRVMLLGVSIGKWLGYSHGDLEELSKAAMLFDLGKMKMPEFILTRQQKLGSKEYEMIQKHPEFSYDLLKEEKTISEAVLQGVLLHHERMDGSGYPFGLKGDKIHEFAKIIAISDTFDALTSERSYARKRTILEAIEEIEYMGVHLLDPQMVYLLANKLSNYYVGNRVVLNTGFSGEIIFINPKWPTKPVIRAGTALIDLKRTTDIQIVEMMYGNRLS